MSEKSPQLRPFRLLADPEEPELALSWAAGVARDGKNERNGSNRVGWMYNRRWSGGQNGNSRYNALPGFVRRLSARWRRHYDDMPVCQLLSLA